MSIKIGEPIRIQNEKDVDLYDMYILEITDSNGKNKKEIKLFTECDTIDIETESNEIQKYFFYDRLFIKGGLIEQQGREDYIYLGRLVNLDNGKYTADRMMKRSDGKIAQDYFEEMLPFLMKALEPEKKQSKENEVKTSQQKSDFKEDIKATPTQNNMQQSGKNYVCSDIHGMYGSYQTAIKQLKDNDHLWILGDAMDRGKYGIKILQDIMQRKNVTYLLGNHDYFLIETSEIMKRYNLSEHDVENILYWGGYKAKNGMLQIRISDMQKMPVKDEQWKELMQQRLREQKEISNLYNEYSQKVSRLVKERNIQKYDIDFITNWGRFNGGTTTILDYAKLPDKDKEAIYNFLINSKVFYANKIGSRDIAFTHSVPLKIYNNPSKEQLYMSYTYKELLNVGFTKGQVIDFLQAREDENGYEENYGKRFKAWKQYGFTTICGHEPSHGAINDQRHKGYIRIDTNCPHKGNLALYCVEDDNVMYIPSKEEPINEMKSR